MSQIIKNLADGPVPPSVATSYVTQDGTAVPSDNILIIDGLQSSEDNDNGIISKGGTPATNNSNEVDIVLTNRLTNNIITTDATLTTIITFDLGIHDGTYYISGNVQAFDFSTPASAAYSFSGGYRTDGSTATELGTEFHDTFQDSALLTSDIFLSTSGNNVLLQVQGVNDLIIYWNSILEYRKIIFNPG